MFLGLDLGTTNVKAILVDVTGSILAVGSAPVERFTTPQGGVEQDIDQIWNATCHAIREAAAVTTAKKIQAVGVSSQGGALQLLDAQEEPIGHVISWLDPRGKPFDHQLEQQLGKTYLISHIGSNFSTMVLGQLLRLQQESSNAWNAAKQIGFVGDVIVGRLCGRRACDPTSLSIAQLYNPSLGDVDREMLEHLKIDHLRLPDLVPVAEPAGRLGNPVARQIGLPAGIPVSPAVHDQYAASIGAGTVTEGDLLVGTGTAWVLLATTGCLSSPVAPRTFVCPHPVGGLFGQLLSMHNGGSAIQWALQATGQTGLQGEVLDAHLESVPPAADGLRFWPHLMPGGPKFESFRPGGHLAGILLAHTANHLLRAVVEGLACELNRHLERFTRTGLPVTRLVVSGPAATSRVTPQILADLTNRPVTTLNQSAVSSFGAATIARAMVDPNLKLRELAVSLAPVHHTLVPGQHAAVYQALFQEYLQPLALPN